MENKLNKYAKYDKVILENREYKILSLDIFGEKYRGCAGGCCEILKDKLKLDNSISICCHYCKLYDKCNSIDKCDLEVEIEDNVVLSCEYDIYYDKEEIDEEY